MSEHPFSSLPDRGKEPTSKRHLDAWIQQAQAKTGVAVGRLGWLVASSVVIAAPQRSTAEDGYPRLLLKGGAYLETRLGLRSRATKDIDALFRGDFDELIDVLDESIRKPWGALELQRTEVQAIEGARRIVKPRRFKVKLLVNGQTWRTVDVEVAADEGLAGAEVDVFPGLPLGHFGLPSPVEFAGIVFDYQVAQKLHACSDPHRPPEEINDRARDIVDLLLIRAAFYRDGADAVSLRAACADLFECRAAEARMLGAGSRQWPPTVVAYEHWHADFEAANVALGLGLDLVDAVATLNEWISEIDAASPD
jgi:nucleotidyltransferase AbiEii toxin of type IV toxin-antitoxin system